MWTYIEVGFERETIVGDAVARFWDGERRGSDVRMLRNGGEAGGGGGGGEGGGAPAADDGAQEQVTHLIWLLHNW